MKFLNGLSLTLSIIGAVNWGIVGLFDYNFVSSLLGDGTAFTRVIYALVGLSGLYLITFYGILARRDS